MTDDRNSGVPPAQGHAPPPLAPPAAPVPPPYQPAPAPWQPAARSGPGLWPLFTVLAFLVGAGGTILTLWLTGDLWNSRTSTSSSTVAGSAQGGGLNPATSMTPPPASVPSPGPATTGGTAPTPASLPGSWGPACPGSADEAITFYADGTASSDGESGTWSLDGNYVNLNNGRESLTLYWEMVGSGSARVRRAGDSQSRIVNRCP